MELAVMVEIMQLKITKTIKENKGNLKELQDKVKLLEEEKNELYKGNKQVIEKILNVYAKEVK